MGGAILKMPKGMFSATFGDDRAKGLKILEDVQDI
jgi:hypothetical protein